MLSILFYATPMATTEAITLLIAAGAFLILAISAYQLADKSIIMKYQDINGNLYWTKFQNGVHSLGSGKI